MNVTITANTRFNTDEIRQVWRVSDVIHGDVHEYIMNLRDQGVREALKKLGWTPPGEETEQNQRDALAAHAERQRETLQWIWDKVNLGGRAHERVKTALADTPETSLARLKARWQAEVLESCENMTETSFMPYLGREEQVVLMVDILKVAEELRRQAEGGEP